MKQKALLNGFNYFYFYFFNVFVRAATCVNVCDRGSVVAPCPPSLPLRVTQHTRLLPPGSGGEAGRPSAQQRMEMAAQEHEWGFRCKRKEKKRRRSDTTPLCPFFLLFPQKPPPSAPLPLLCCWLLWCQLWRPASAGLDFLTKPLGVRAATAAAGRCARPKLTQLTSLLSLWDLTKK